MKRVAGILLAIFTSIGFVSCADVQAPAPFDVATDNANVAKVNYSTDPDAEGCYTNGDYGIEVICQEKNNDGCAYNFTLFSLDDGAQSFFGTGKGSFKCGVVFKVSDMTDPDAFLTCTVEEDLSLSIEYTCRGVVVVTASGRYEKCADGGVFNWETAE